MQSGEVDHDHKKKNTIANKCNLKPPLISAFRAAIFILRSQDQIPIIESLQYFFGIVLNRSACKEEETPFPVLQLL